MGYDVQFVDSIAESPTTRLNLSLPPWRVRDTTTFGQASLRRAVVSTLLADGERYPAAAYDNRMLTLVVRVDADSDDAVAAAKQQLYRELDRPTNILRYRPGTSLPVFFRTFRTTPDAVTWNPFEKEATVRIPAEPFALGLRETLTTVTVSNDPDSPAPANANPYFETNANNWTPVGGSFARSTAQFHQGAASGLLTPDGASAQVRVESDQVTVTAGSSYRASAWMRCASTRSVDVNINWFGNSGATYLSTSTATIAVTAGTWTYGELIATAPAGADRATVQVSMTGTPPASDLVYVDEAMIRADDIGQAVDVTGVLGDVETPLYLSVGSEIQTGGPNTTAIAVRRRGTPSAAPAVVQAEDMGSSSVDTTVQPYDAAMSGTGSNYMRCTFSSTTALADRLSLTNWPSGASVDIRGTYRLFVRYRKSVSGDTITMRWRISNLVGDTYTLPAGTSPAWQDLGLISIPVGLDPVYDGLSGTELPAGGLSSLHIQAGRTSGSGNLDTDALRLVPADDRLDLVQWPSYASASALVLDSTRNWAYPLGSSGEVRATGDYLGQIAGAAPMVSPGVTNRVHFVRNVGPTVVLDTRTLTTDVTPYYWPRYLYVRPVEES